MEKDKYQAAGMKLRGTGPGVHKGTEEASKPELNIEGMEMANSSEADTECRIIAQTVEGTERDREGIRN